MAHADLPSNPLRKRRKGATRLSCAECRRSDRPILPFLLILIHPRLKLRCDRGIPCSSCVKRGCGAICPDVCLDVPCPLSPSCEYRPRAHSPPAKEIGWSKTTSSRCYPTSNRHPALFSLQHKNYMRKFLNSPTASDNLRMLCEAHMLS